MNTTLTGLFTLECVLKIFAFGFRVRKEKRAVSKGGIGGTFLVLVKVDYTSHTLHKLLLPLLSYMHNLDMVNETCLELST